MEHQNRKSENQKIRVDSHRDDVHAELLVGDAWLFG